LLQQHAGAEVKISDLAARLPFRLPVLAGFDGRRGWSGKSDGSIA
jgi:hypothetical protein